MAGMDFSKLPTFDQLPVSPDKPAESNWGVFGEDDEMGCANLLNGGGDHRRRPTGPPGRGLPARHADRVRRPADVRA